MMLCLARGRYFKMTSKIDKICETVIRTDTKVKEIHKVMFGNGQPGLVAEHNQMKGGLKLLKILIGFSITLAVGILGFLTKVHIFSSQ